MNTRAGRIKTSLSGELSYSSFVPSPLPPNPPVQVAGPLLASLVNAHARLAALDAVVARVPEAARYVPLLVLKEALMSSQMEGIGASLEDVLDPRNNADTNPDVAEVRNYVDATLFAIGLLETMPPCSRLIGKTHAVLMKGKGGPGRTPGEFRTTQNWIGAPGSTPASARHVPPNPRDMLEAMNALETYMNADDGQDVLVRAALVHYQFETIRPFLDGNGRMGRILIILFLMHQGVLTQPALYPSLHLKQFRGEYYALLAGVREKGDFERWTRFFLDTLAESAEDALRTLDLLKDLHERDRQKLLGKPCASKAVLAVFEHLQEKPLIDIGSTAQKLGLSFNAAAAAVQRLQDADILVQSGGARRKRVFAHKALLAILRSGAVPGAAGEMTQY